MDSSGDSEVPSEPSKAYSQIQNIRNNNTHSDKHSWQRIKIWGLIKWLTGLGRTVKPKQKLKIQMFVLLIITTSS